MVADRRILAAALPLGFAALTGLVAARFGPLLHLDASVSAAALRFARSHHAWRTCMSVITHSADRRILVPALLLAVAFGLWRRDRAGVVFALAAAAAATVLRLAVLALVHRPRPPDPLTAAAGWAFPSGHTTSATVAAGIAVVLLWPLLRGRRARAFLVAVAVTWAALVGVSRVALTAHWPTDVLGGWLLAGSVLAALAATPFTRGRTRPRRQSTSLQPRSLP